MQRIERERSKRESSSMPPFAIQLLDSDDKPVATLQPDADDIFSLETFGALHCQRRAQGKQLIIAQVATKDKNSTAFHCRRPLILRRPATVATALQSAAHRRRPTSLPRASDHQPHQPAYKHVHHWRCALLYDGGGGCATDCAAAYTVKWWANDRGGLCEGALFGQ